MDGEDQPGRHSRRRARPASRQHCDSDGDTSMKHHVYGMKPGRRVQLRVDRVGGNWKRAVDEAAKIGRPIRRAECAPHSGQRLHHRIEEDDEPVVQGELIPQRAEVDDDGNERHGEIDP